MISSDVLVIPPFSLEWLKVLGPLLLAIVVAVATWQFQKWQVRLAKQKLRHDLYDRRLAIYVAFQELLIALPEKSDDEIKGALRKASIARFEAQFLLDDPKLHAYLESLCKEVSDNVLANITYLDVMKTQATSDPQVRQDYAERANRLGMAKLEVPGRHLVELSEQFSKHLKLTDFWR
jgi:hypothetical protein